MRALALLLCLSLCGCPAALAAAKGGCAVVNVAEQACMLLTFVGSDGKPHTVTCSPEELTAYGKVVEARHSAQPPQ